MSKLRVVTIVGTRPELIRLAILTKKLDKFTEHTLIHTGQNIDHELNHIFFDELQIRKPDFELKISNSSPGKFMGELLANVEKLLIDLRPDAVLILGDTNSAISAIIAERMQIPVYHMEAGNRSFDLNVPEELNRKLVDHVSSFNLAYSEHAVRNLLSEGIHPRRVIKTGSPLVEVFDSFKGEIKKSTILEDLQLKNKAYFLMSFHRQENVDSEERLGSILNCVNHIKSKWGMPILISTHPRTRKQLEKMGVLSLENVNFHKPFGYLAYSKLQMNAYCVISDSGSIAEESAIMNFPAVILRESMERPEALEAGSIAMAGIDAKSLEEAIAFTVKRSAPTSLPEDYEINNFSERVLNFLLSTAHLNDFWSNLHKKSPQS